MRITKKKFKALCEKYGLVFDDGGDTIICTGSLPEDKYKVDIICTGSLPEDKYKVDEWQALIELVRYDNDKYLTAEFWCGLEFNFDVVDNKYKINYDNSVLITDYNVLEQALSKMMTILNQLQFIPKMFNVENQKKSLEKDFE